ncbi:hypothetical protein CU097_004530 [Rhizopus azygosporus]|uniref:UBA domain-containing protein n=1 Tax=Rhizopus azygosporus TaxID=86630 RepID=A0A367J7T8_RHIAZ|nr:hypothetical protein CU097_004530 [Rhizopus azygosporus]
MEDLLDLSWSSTTSTLKDNKKQQPAQKKDAFADLLAIGSNSKDEKPTLSSLAEQKRHQHQAWATATRSEPLTPTKHTPSQLTPPSSQPASTHSSKPFSFDDLLNPFGTSNKTDSGKSTPLNQLRNNAKPTTPTPTQSSEQWNFDLLDTLPAEKSNNTAPIGDDIFGDLTQESHTASVKGSSYGEHTGYDEDNPLGILAEPVQSKPADFEVDEPRVQLDESEVALSYQDTLKEEEEDEMLARLIDMGFSMQQSKFAIEATGGHDLQAAIDLLMQSSEPAQRYQSRIPDNSHNNRHQPSPTEQARNALFTTKSNDQQQHQRQGVDDMLHIQTEKIVGQAQELGGMLYKNAASFIKLGRERVTKAVGDWQEQQRVQRLKQLQEQQKSPVRPKWMTAEIETVDLSTASVEKFADDDTVYEKKRPEQPARSASGTPKMRQQQRQSRTRALIDDEDEPVYVSPSRRKPTPTSSGRSTPQSAMTGSVRQESTAFAPKPKQRTRPVVNASADIIAKVKQAKEQGNEKYKLGQFGEAEEAYTRAIELLPAGHDHQVILCNNRAMTRLKIGDYKKCIEDCDLAITLCKESGEGSDVSEGVVISWRDQLLKSLNRKAEALENIERYKDALNVYEEIVKIEGSGNAKTNQSMSRCRQALNPKPTRSPSPAARVEAPEKKQDFMSMFDPASAPTVKEPTVSAEELSKSKAVAEIRAKAAEKEAEDAERLSKTDDINARLVAWKAGKEQNLRALLATLDTLLWPEAQWKGAQMSDLIDVKKCKIIYMKAISKVHPDKLPSNASVEQKMLASGIFATLNEAWDAFKLQCF